MWGDGTFGVGMGLRIVRKVSATRVVMVTRGTGAAYKYYWSKSSEKLVQHA